MRKILDRIIFFTNFRIVSSSCFIWDCNCRAMGLLHQLWQRLPVYMSFMSRKLFCSGFLANHNRESNMFDNIKILEQKRWSLVNSTWGLQVRCPLRDNKNCLQKIFAFKSCRYRKDTADRAADWQDFSVGILHHLDENDCQ